MSPSAATASPLLLAEATRASLWNTLISEIERYLRSVEQLPVSPVLDARAIRGFAESFNFEQALPPEETLRSVAAALTRYQVHTPPPNYYGLFNPASTTMSIAADALVAALNPQLAAWSHSPLASEIELHLIRSLAEKFGIPRDKADGVFTSGGAEANHTALLTALFHRSPEIADKGLRALD